MKLLMWIVGSVVLLVVAVGVYVALFSGDLVKDAIEEYAPAYLGTGVRVSAVDISLAEGSGEVRGLQIDNPAGFGGGHAFKLGTIKLLLDPAQISQNLVVLKSVQIDGAEIAAVAKGSSTNLQQLMDNLAAAMGPENSEPDDGSEVKLIIDRLDFTNAKTTVSSDVLGDLSVNIPDIHLKDVGRASDGATIGEVIKQLLDPVYKNVSKAMIAQGLNLDVEGHKGNLKDKISEKIGGGLKGFTDLLEPAR
ncbi:MAG: hypothetical protein VB948_11140 [Pseudomonadales bacterium]